MFALFYFGSVVALGLSMTLASHLDSGFIASRKVGGIRFTRFGRFQVSTCYVKRGGA